jgi:hypothetical protein
MNDSLGSPPAWQQVQVMQPPYVACRQASRQAVKQLSS